jgi:hypothetical protein
VTKNNDLIFMLGEETSSTHNATMVFEPKVTGDLKGDLIWETDRFLSMLKIAGNNPVTLKLTSRGVLGTTIESKLGVYDYCLRAAKR